MGLPKYTNTRHMVLFPHCLAIAAYVVGADGLVLSSAISLLKRNDKRLAARNTRIKLRLKFEYK